MNPTPRSRIGQSQMKQLKPLLLILTLLSPWRSSRRWRTNAMHAIGTIDWSGGWPVAVK